MCVFSHWPALKTILLTPLAPFFFLLPPVSTHTHHATMTTPLPPCPRCRAPAPPDPPDADAAAHGVTACRACGYVLDDAPLAAGGAAAREEAGATGRVYVGEDGDGAGTGNWGDGAGGRLLSPSLSLARAPPPLRVCVVCVCVCRAGLTTPAFPLPPSLQSSEPAACRGTPP